MAENMACIKDFNDTLFELTDEMLAIIQPSAVMTTAYGVFKNLYANDPENDVAVNAFWEVAKDNAELIQKKDVQAMADVLRSVIPMPGMVDEVWEALSEENRGVVGDYVLVLYEQAADIQSTRVVVGKEDKERKDTTVYSMYNRIWSEFLLLLESKDPGTVSDARAKFEHVLSTKGSSSDMPFHVLLPCLELVIPKNAIENEADVVKLCLPPGDAVGTMKDDCQRLEGILFPFDRKVPFSQLLNASKVEKVAMYWHYIKLFTVCIHECPPEVVGMMDQMVSMFFRNA